MKGYEGIARKLLESSQELVHPLGEACFRLQNISHLGLASCLCSLAGWAAPCGGFQLIMPVQEPHPAFPYLRNLPRGMWMDWTQF